MTDDRSPTTARSRRGRRVAFWLSEDEWLEFEELRRELGTRSARATITRTVKTALTLSLEMFDRRQAQIPVDVNRRATPGRRGYDGADAAAPKSSVPRRRPR